MNIRWLILPAVLAVLFAIMGLASAAFTDTAISWDLFLAPDGYTIPYTFNGQPVSDEEGSSDSTNGGSAVSPSGIDLSSGSPNGTNPGPYDTPSYGYYDGGTPYDPNDPTTMEDDYIRFTMRLDGDPRSGTQANKTDFASYHWNVLLDVDGDGYKEFWIDLNGGYASGTNQYDQLQILYDNFNDQVIPDPDAARVAEFTAYNYEDAGGLSHTRVRQATDGTGDWFIDIQVPMTAFTDLLGNQVLYPDSPVGFVFSTGASATNPLQKDFMTDLGFLTENDPINFGDIVKSNGEPDLYFSDADLNQVYSYTQGDDIYLYLRDVFANTDTSAVDTVTVTVTNPTTGDDEIVTLTETGPNTGIFSNRGGYDNLVASSPTTAWVPFVKTSIVATDESWTLAYDAATGNWAVTGSVSGLQSSTATAGTEYTSDDGSVTFTIYENGTPADGTAITFDSYAGDALTSSGTAGADDDGDLQVASGQTIYYTYTNDSGSYSDSVPIVGPGEPFILFTRADGTPSSDFTITTDTATSDKLYVTVYHSDSNTNPATAQTITISLSGNDSESSITLTETGPDTGIFRNTTGLNTQIYDGARAADDGLWEDIDGGVVTATFNYGGTDYTNTATLFSTDAAGKVNFTNGAGTVGVTQYSVNEPIFVRVQDEVACPDIYGNLTAIVNSTAGDSETITLYETAPGSAIFMNRENDLITTSGSDVVTSISSTFISDGVQPGDTFVIATGPDTGTYTVSFVLSENDLILTQTLTATRTDVGFTAQPLMTATSDGSFAADGILEADHDDTITVYYDDCDDGDGDPSNDYKTDTATYNAPPIVINEVLFYPQTQTYPGTGTDYLEYEYVQLYNASNTAINITDYSITDTDGFSYTVPQFSGKAGDPLNGNDITLQPGEKIYIVLVEQDGTGQSTPEHDYDSTNGIYYVYVLNDSSTGAPNSFNDPGTTDTGDQITLYDASSNTVDYVAWSTTSSNTADFLSDDGDAVGAGIWQDNDYKDVSTITQGQAIKRSTDGVDTDQPSDWTYVSSTANESFIITQAVLTDFEIDEDNNHVTLQWETASEVGTVGFELLRLNSRTNRYERVNRMLLPSAPGSMEGASYRIEDRKAAPGSLLAYKLVEVEHNGARRVFGPFTNATGTGTPYTSPKALEGTAITGITSEESDVYIVTLEDNTILVTDDPLGERRAARMLQSSASKQVTVFNSSEDPSVRSSVIKANESDITFTVVRKQKRQPARNDKGTQRITGSGPVVKIAVSTDGIHYISASELAPVLGLSVKETGSLIKSSSLSLKNKGQSVAYLTAETHGFYFYAQAPDSIYTNENIYYLTRGEGERISMFTSAPTSATGEVAQTFTRTIHLEEDLFSATALADGPTDDYWYWDFVVSEFPAMGVRSFEISPPSLASGEHGAVLTIGFKGATAVKDISDHHAVVSVNGTVVGETQWDGTSAHIESFAFPQSLLSDTGNTVAIQGVLDEGVPYSVFYIDSFDLTYQSLYRAQGGSLVFTGDGNGTVTITGFNGSSVLVFDLGDSNHPALLKTLADQDPEGGYTITVTPRSAQVPLIALEPVAAIQPTAIWADMPSDLRSLSNNARYIVITTPGLTDAIQPLIDHRSSQGHTVLVTTVEDIMDEFNHGLESPEAIWSFLRYAYKYWALPPKYVLLVGSGSYDYRDNLGLGGERVPTLMAATDSGLFPSDSALADFDNDSIAELAIGRLPAETAEEALAMVQKTLAFEAASGASWKRNVLLMAGKTDGTARFDIQSEELASLVPATYTITRAYLDELSLSDARSLSLGTLQAGAAFTSYQGHGGLGQLGEETGLLTIDDVPSLSGTERPTVLTAMTCVVGNYGIPGYESLGTALLKAPDGGAAALFAPSGMSQSAKAQILARMLYTEIFTNRPLTLGEAIKRAMDAYALHTLRTDMLRVYNLLGDPALVLE